MIGLGLSVVGGDIAQASSQFNRNIAPFSRTKSLSFDGINDRAHFASDTELVEMFGTGDFSISYWVKGAVVPSGGKNFMMVDHLDVLAGSRVVQIVVGSINGPSASSNPNDLLFTLYDSNTSGGYFVNYISPNSAFDQILENQWNHILISCTKNASDRTVEAWINGVSLGSTTSGNAEDFTGVAFAGNADRIGPGKIGSLSTFTFLEYKIDDFMVFRSASNDTIAQAIYNDNVQLDESSRSNIQAYYKFEGNTSDHTGNNESFKLLGATIVEDAPDGESYALSFDGVNDIASWASGTTLTSLIGAGDFTLSYWAHRADWVTTGATSTTLLTNALNTSPYKQVSLGVLAGTGSTDADLRGAIQVKVADGTTIYIDDVSPNLSSVSGVTDDDWIHVAYVSTVDGVAETRSGQFYINGAAVTTTENTASDDYDFSGLDAGTAGLGAARIFGGWYTHQAQILDDISMYDAALTSSDISNIYNSGVPKDESSRSNLVGYWRMEQNGNDSSSNSNNLTVSGATFTRDIPTS
tara:strand:- start:2340 stop:3914 length:1575 start_codon:yes stop_codon:yes gene_type:complete